MLAAICKSCWALRHDVEGKIVPGGNDASKEKGKKEETLRQNARPSLAGKKNWHGLSKNISREVFYFGPRNSCSPRSIMLETQGTLHASRNLHQKKALALFLRKTQLATHRQRM